MLLVWTLIFMILKFINNNHYLWHYFTHLQAILSRKLIIPEIHDVMKKVRQLSVTSEVSAVRLQCRQVILKFLLDYPLGKKLKNHLEFFVNQIAYPMESGRESSLEMLATIFSAFPQVWITIWECHTNYAVLLNVWASHRFNSFLLVMFSSILIQEIITNLFFCCVWCRLITMHKFLLKKCDKLMLLHSILMLIKFTRFWTCTLDTLKLLAGMYNFVTYQLQKVNSLSWKYPHLVYQHVILSG